MVNFPSEKTLDEIRDRLNKSTASKPLSKEAQAVDRAKFKLCEKFVVYKNNHKLTQRDLSLKIEVPETVIDRILHYHLDKLTVDILVECLSKIYPPMGIREEK